MTSYGCFATTARGLAPLVVEELRALGADSIREGRGGVAFRGSLDVAYAACLWLRCASRVVLGIAERPAASPDELYASARAISWEDHIGASATIAVDCTLVRSSLSNDHYAALRVKDAIVDRLRDLRGARPSVDTQAPDVRVNVHVHETAASIRIDLSGDALHRRGYRVGVGEAPLKETLAAAILMRSKWPEIGRSGGPLVDPMCGAGTFPIEAAWIAGDIAPGLVRRRFGLEGWLGHDPKRWTTVRAEARARGDAGRSGIPRIVGFDHDRSAVQTAIANVERAGLRGVVHIERRPLAGVAPIEGDGAGLVVANPPWGERLGDARALGEVYGELGRTLKRGFVGWRAAVLTSNAELGRALRLWADQKHTIYNGNVECVLLGFAVDDRRELRESPRKPAPTGQRQALANRLSKNLSKLRTWAVKQDVTCFRVYDADIPEYNFAIDQYGDRVHVQEYEAPKTIDPGLVEARRSEVLDVVPQALGVDAADVHLKVRRRQRGRQQYQRMGQGGELFEVVEGGHRFLVNLTDYLDTGLFLDQRPTRQLLGEQSAGRRFLNLFAYTGTATVYAARGGATSSLTVDMSRTYLDWARRNFECNHMDLDQHELLRTDCVQWLARHRQEYDLIFLDPPTFSNSKKMAEPLDLQRDHVELVRLAAARLAASGELWFSTNAKKFELDVAALADLAIEDVTARTIPFDFRRTPRIHRCWRITARGT